MFLRILRKIVSFYILTPCRYLVAAYLRIKTRKKIQSFLNERDQIFIEVGAGNKPGNNNWLTIDMTERCDIYWDLRLGIPFPDATVSKIYSSHFLEHLTYEETQRFLDESFRVLKPGGTFSVCVPNARIYLEAYVKGERLDEAQFFGVYTAYHKTTPIDYVNYIAYMQGHHKYMFDMENLLYILQAKGFKNVRKRAFDPELDLQVRDHESIYAIAEK